MTSSNGIIFRVTDPFCGEFAGLPVYSPHKGQWRGALTFSLICAWTNGWVNNRDAGNLRRHHANYDVTVMHRQCPAIFTWGPFLKFQSPYAYVHEWPSTQPGSLHTAVQRKYTQPCSLFSRGTAVWTMGARLCEQWGTAVCKCPAV